jgi:DNA gyrase inhibitor GyrI/AraC-like DNA-binding protein
MKLAGMKASQFADIYRDRINRVIDHITRRITQHPGEPLSLSRLSRLAGFSRFHFHRLFRTLVGEPLHAYVRRLRLERAVFHMAHGPRATLTEIALQCGFTSSSDFSRSFKQAYGFAPRRYSREAFLANSKIRQDLVANAGYGLRKLVASGNPDRFRVRLVERPAQRIAYVRVIGGYQPEGIMAGYQRLMDWGRSHRLVPGAELIGMSPDDPDITPMSRYRFDWCLAVPPSTSGGRGVTIGHVPANRFACIHIRGDIGREYRAWTYLFHDWLPRSGYQPTNDPAMEVYRRDPAASQWQTFDLDCCLPIMPLQGGPR